MAPILAGRDVIGRSRTGTGKTLAFGMPSAVRLLELLKKAGKCEVVGGKNRMQRGRLPSMIVMCPTRELARQVEGELREVCQPLGLFTEVFHGGVSYDPQVSVCL
jgi:ATP-dependent RNA helicase DDX21